MFGHDFACLHFCRMVIYVAMISPVYSIAEKCSKYFAGLQFRAKGYLVLWLRPLAFLSDGDNGVHNFTGLL